MKRKTTLRVAAFAVILGLMFYASSEAQSALVKYADSIGAYFRANAILGGIIFIAVSALAVLLSPFSSVPLVPSAIMAWGNFTAFWLLYLGWIIGGVIAYFVGSFFSEKIIKRFIPLEKVDYYRERISANSQFWLVFLFRLAIPSEAASYTLGIIRYDFWKYFAVTILTEIVFALFVVYSSAILLSGKILYFSAVILAGGAVLYFLYRYVQRRIKKQ
ncbi:MAG: VTT domain-containing protein [Parcubacteria group bacterium]